MHYNVFINRVASYLLVAVERYRYASRLGIYVANPPTCIGLPTLRTVVAHLVVNHWPSFWQKKHNIIRWCLENRQPRYNNNQNSGSLSVLFCFVLFCIAHLSPSCLLTAGSDSSARQYHSILRLRS
jgi:hypothetical protein